MSKYVDKTTNTINRYVAKNKQLSPEELWLARGSLATAAINSVLQNIKPGSTIIELGSGFSTKLFSQYYSIYAVEHDLKWLEHKIDGVNYIHAPLKEYKPFFSDKELWYDVEVLKRELPIDYEAIIVDGPSGSKFSRYGFVHNLDIFKRCDVLFDDVHAVNVYMVMIETMNKWQVNNALLYNIERDKAFAWINGNE